MIVERLNLENFMRYRKRCELDFRGKKTIGIVGGNESGKSTLLQAISYGLYGRTRADRELQLINDNADGPAVVELAVRFPDDTLLELTRGRTTKNESICKVAGYGEMKPSAAAECIAEHVRLSYDDFIALTYFLQGDLHQFMEGNKRAYFQRWTEGLRVWQRYEDAAGTHAMDLQENIYQADHELQRCEERLEAASETKAEARAAKVELQQLKDELTQRQEQVETLQEEYQETAASGVDVQGEVEDLRKALQDAQREHQAAEHALRAEQRALQQVRSGRCPVLHGVDCELLAEAGAKARERHRKEIAALEVREQNTLRSVHAAKKKLDGAIEDAHKKYLSGLNSLRVQLKQAQHELRDTNTALRRATSRYEKAVAAFKDLREAAKLKRTVEKDKAKWETSLRRMHFIKYMCGRSGIPALLIESELERVEDRCNWVLERLDYGKRIRFSGYRELANYEKVCPACGGEEWYKQECKGCGTPRPRQRREEPTVTVLDGSVERPFALESGGAQVLQSFAVRLAGGLFVSNMSGVPMRMIMLDEVFGMLDSANRQKLMALVIDKLATEFGLQQQFVVSHQEDIINSVDNLLRVRSEKGSAVARWD